MKQRKPESTKGRRLAKLPAIEAPRVASLVQSAPLPDHTTTSTPEVSGSRRKYPHLTVYLPRKAVRLIKEIGLDQERRFSDILADAVNEYLIKRGYKSLKELAD
jgi:hypothetical protein